MTQGRSSSISSGKLLTELGMAKLITSLTSDLAGIEDEMIVEWRAGKSKISNTSSDNYLASMKELVERLRSIALALFNETEISKVKPYREKDKIPENYDKYLRVSENLAKLVTQDILYQPDVDHAVAVFDRWLYICKIAFHQHDFFTSSCILNGLSAMSVTLSKVENELCQASTLLFKYYRNVLEKSSSLYHKQNELLKYKFEVIPTLHVLTNLYDKLGAKPPKGEKPTTTQVAEMKMKRRAVSKNFSLMQKKQRPELDESDDAVLSDLYKKFDEKYVGSKDGDNDEEKTSYFDVRSKTLKSLVEKLDRKSTSTFKPFSIANFSNLADERVELIIIWAYLESIESKYDASVRGILYNVKSILANVELTDRVMRHKINDEFDLADVKIGKKLRKLHKKINQLLLRLIKDEIEHGIEFKNDELKEAASSEEMKVHSDVKKSSHKLKEVSESRAATEEKSTPKVLPKARERKAPSLSDAESESSRPASQSVVRSIPLPVSGAPKLELSKIEPLPVAAMQVSTPSSVRSELEELKTARSVSLGKTAYEEMVKKSGGSIPVLPAAVVSPRVKYARSSSATFFITKAQNSSGSLSARLEGQSKEAGMDSPGGGMGVERLKQ